MSDNNPFKDTILLLKIWLLHYLIYYFLFGLIFHSTDYLFKGWHFSMEYITKIFISPIAGMIGLYDGLIFIIPIVISYFLKLKFDVFKSYYYTVLLCQFGLYFISILFSDRPSTINFRRNIDEESLNINYIFVIIQCIIISIFVNWLVFKKSYNKLKN